MVRSAVTIFFIGYVFDIIIRIRVNQYVYERFIKSHRRTLLFDKFQYLIDDFLYFGRGYITGRIELLEDLEKRLHKSLEQIVKREGYPNVQAFQKVYNKAEELIIEYNEELRAWKNQTEQKKEKPLEQPKKASVLEKLHCYQQEGRQQQKQSVKKKSIDRER